MLAVASNLFGKSSTLSAYALHSSTPSASPASSSTHLPGTASSTAKSFNVGLWRVVGATHKTTNKDVSVWVFEKKVLDGIKGASQTRDWAMEQLKKEVSSISRTWRCGMWVANDGSGNITVPPTASGPASHG